MSVLIIGSSGLIGSHLVEFLLAKNMTVIGYDVNTTYKKNKSSGYIFEQGSVEDFPFLASVIKKHEIEMIVHAGGVSHPKSWEQSPNKIIQTNVVGTSNVFEAARLFGIKKVIYLSSAAVYGENTSRLLNENEKPDPATIYGASKITGEYLAKIYTNEFGLQVTSLRIPFVYGPGRKMHEPIKFLLEKAIKGENINEESGMDQKLEFIYVKDVVAAIWLALRSRESIGEIINIGAGKLTSMREIVDVLTNIFPNVSIEIGSGDFGYKETAPLDCTKAESILKFTPKYSITKGIYEYTELIKN